MEIDEPTPPYVTCFAVNGRLLIERDQFGQLTVWTIVRREDGDVRTKLRFDGDLSKQLAKSIYGIAGLREPKEKKQ